MRPPIEGASSFAAKRSLTGPAGRLRASRRDARWGLSEVSSSSGIDGGPSSGGIPGSARSAEETGEPVNVGFEASNGGFAAGFGSDVLAVGGVVCSAEMGSATGSSLRARLSFMIGGVWIFCVAVAGLVPPVDLLFAKDGGKGGGGVPLLVLRSSDGIGGGRVPLAIAEDALSDVLEEVVFSDRFEDVACLDLLAVTALSVSLAEFGFSDCFAGGKAGGITCFFLALSPLLLDGLAFLVRSLDVLDVDFELGGCDPASRRADRLGGRGPSVPFALASSPVCLFRLVS